MRNPITRMGMSLGVVTLPIMVRLWIGDPSWHYAIGPQAVPHVMGVFVILSAVNWLRNEA
jgi:hypothetical protein